MSGDSIWIKDIEILFREDKLRDFFPNEAMTDYEKINSIMRFSIYFALLLYLMKDDSNYLYIPVITGVIIYFLYSVNTRNNRVEKIDDSFVEVRPRKANYRLPTKNNPFMNLSIMDYGSSKVSKPALRNRNTTNTISAMFNKLFRNTNDLYDKDNFLRQYHTMPVTTVPDNRIKFAKWCYRSKSKKGQYNRYSPLNNRLHR